MHSITTTANNTQKSWRLEFGANGLNRNKSQHQNRNECSNNSIEYKLISIRFRLNWKTIIGLSTAAATMFPEQFSTCYWNNRILEVTHESKMNTCMLMNFTWSTECVRVCIYVCMCVHIKVYLVCKTDPDWTNIQSIALAHVDIGYIFNSIDKYSTNWNLSIACG